MSKDLLQEMDRWPVVWRVVAPACGSYDHDMVHFETTDQAAALAVYEDNRAAGWPVRLERVQCGPLPAGFNVVLQKIRSHNPQNPGTVMREVLGAWTGGT